MQTKPRYELVNARLLRGWTEADVAKRLDHRPDVETVRRWEAGIQTPRSDMIGALCTLFKVMHPKELNLDAQFNEDASTQSREEFEEMLRRKALEYIGATAIVASVDPGVVLRATVDDPNEFLRACRVVLDDCWNPHDQNRNTLIVDSTIKTLMPGLRTLAMNRSPYQHEASLLAVEARVLQIIIATHNMDYKRRISLGDDIVLIGETSSDKNLHAMAIGWHIDTYVNHYFQPETAIAIYKNALPRINDVSPLNQAAIYMELAKACALDRSDTDKEAKKARDYVELARQSMPENPESDPLYRQIDLGNAEFGMLEGNMYLVLANRFPSKKEYAQTAFDTLVKATSQEAMSIRYRCQALITQADAACCIANMNCYFDCLEEGVCIARQISSDREITQAVTTLQKAPRKWRNEQRYRELRKMLTPSIIVARR